MSLINSAEPIYTQIANKNLAHNNVVIRGINDSISVGGHTAGAGANLLKFKTNLNNENISVVSTSTADVDGGAGAHIILIKGIYIDTNDSNKFKHKTTTWTMNGLTPVSTPTTGTNGFVAVNSMEVLSNGTHKLSNTGEITARFGVSDIVNLIHVEAGQSHSAFYAVKSGKELLIKEINITTLLQTACQIQVYILDLDTGLRTLIDKISLNGDENINQQLNLLVVENHIVYAILVPLESIVGTNHFSLNMSAIET